MKPGEQGPTKDEIMACSDAASLALWYRDAVETFEEIKATVEGMRTAGAADEGWLQRVGKKMGYLRMAARWCELRMLALELPVPYLPSDPRKVELRRLSDRIKQLHGLLHQAGVAIPAERMGEEAGA